MGPLLRGASAGATRLVATVLAVALAVTLVAGTFILTDTVDAAFHEAAAPPRSSSDVVVRATGQFRARGNSLPERETLPESLLARVAAVPGVKAAWGAVQGYAALVDARGRAIGATGLPTVGSGWAPGDTLAAGRPPQGPGEVAIDAETAAEHGLGLGDRVRVVFPGGAREFTIGGLLRQAAGLVAATQAIFDPTTAQRVLGHDGQVDAIPVRAAPGLSAPALRARINAVLPERYEAVTSAQAAREAEQSWTEAVSFLPAALLTLAAVALLVGAYVIANTFSILVARRTRELGLLRALGAGRGQLTALVLAEAVVVGLVASGAGLLLGFGAARGLLALFQRMGYEPPAHELVFRPRTAVAAVLCGVLVTALAAFRPVRRATRVSPMGAVGGRRAERAATIRPRRRLALTGALLTAGLVLLGVFGGRRSPLAFGAGAVAVLVGLAGLTPAVAGPAARLIGGPFARLLGPPASLGRRNAVRSPARTAATASALMIGVASMGVVAILVASMRASAGTAVERSLRADFVVAPAATSVALPAAVAERLRSRPEVARVSEVRAGQWGLAGKTQTLVAVDPATATRLRRVDASSAAALRRLGDTGVLVRDTVAERHGWRVGDRVPMTFARTGTRWLRLDSTFSTTAVRTDYVISVDAYRANFAQQFDVEVDVELAGGTTPAAGRAAIGRALADFPVARVMDRAQLLAAQHDQVDTLLMPVSVLLALCVVIALLGIANTLALSIHERTRELGVLRAIGMGRAQVRSMIRSEAVIVAALGSLLGAGVAVLFGWALVASLRHLGVTRWALPVAQLGGLVVVASAAGLAASVVPARRAARLPVLGARGRVG